MMNSVLVETLENLELTSEKFWNVSRQTGNFLSILVLSINAGNVLEIGTSNGYSTLWFADALKRTKGHLTTIEYWEKRQVFARENIEKCDLSDFVTFKIGEAYEVITSEINEQFDIVFMDANKNDYLKFFEAVHPLLKKGGILLADNVLSHADKVKPFVDLIMSRDDYRTQILDLPDGLLTAYKYKDEEICR